MKKLSETNHLAERQKSELEKENAELKKAAREMLDLLVENAPIQGLYLSSIDEWDCLLSEVDNKG